MSYPRGKRREFGSGILLSVPHPFGGPTLFDSDEPGELFFVLGERVKAIAELIVWIRFREFWAPAKAAASGGGATSGSQSTPSGGGSTSGAHDDTHSHIWARHLNNGGIAGTARTYEPGFNAGGVSQVELETNTGSDNLRTSTVGTLHTHSTPAHTHPSHDHTVPGHGHDLDYGIFREALPGSIDVNLGIYRRELEGGSWDLLASVSGIEEAEVAFDFEDVIEDEELVAGLWRVTLQSAAGQPQGGRLAADVAGTALVTIMSIDGV